MITFHLQKTTDLAGTNPVGTFNNDLAVTLRNVDTGRTMNIPLVSCAGRLTCSFSVPVNQLITQLSLTGTDNFEVDVTSPPTGGIYVGTTGVAGLSACP